jgi:hypothetical protein
MDPIIVHSRIGPDGVLHLDVPVGAEVAARDVRVTIEQAERTASRPRPPEEWQASVREVTEGLAEESFRRH